jgi:hypothetical protein
MLREAALPYPPEAGTQPGNSLRDYFAAAALQGMLAGPSGARVFDNPRLVACLAFGIADEMLRAAKRTAG